MWCISSDHVKVKSISSTWDRHNFIIRYLQDGVLLNDKKEARKLRMQVARYSLLNNELYKRTYDGPLAKCLGPNQIQCILEEVHEGHYGSHSGDQALIKCLIRAGYYCPTMKKDALEFI